MWDVGGDEFKPVKYSSFKAEKFEKFKRRWEAILKGIQETSLKSEDKKKLIQELNKLTNDFKV